MKRGNEVVKVGNWKKISKIKMGNIDIEAKTLRFYESGFAQTPFNLRVYTDRFASVASRYINWEVTLDHPNVLQQIDLTIIAVYSKGTWKQEEELNSVIEANATTSQHSYGWGASQPGFWSPGAYQVDLYISGIRLASHSFKVH